MLVDLNGLANLKHLLSLTIHGTIPIATIDLAGLTDLQSLTISEDAALTKIGGLTGLNNLQELSILRNTALTRIDGLAALTDLQWMQITGNTALTTIDELDHLGNLHALMLDGPYASAALARCAQLPALRTVQLESRPEFREAAAQFQVLRKRHKLPDVDFYFFPSPSDRSER